MAKNTPIRISKVDTVIKETIGLLPRIELEKLVLKAAKSDRSFHDFILVNYADQANAEKELCEVTKADLEILFQKRYKGFSHELQMANMLAACHKRINEFGKVCKNKTFELDLIIHVLDIPFSGSTQMFCTCFTQYNYRVVLLVKKAIALLSKLHEDYRFEYEPVLNNYLNTLHGASDHLDFVYHLPKSV